MRSYSRGDPIGVLGSQLAPLTDAWESAERLGREVWSPEVQRARHAWSENLDHYIRCFWLAGLALALEPPGNQWRRLVALMGNEGQDALLDRVIASRQPGRKIGSVLCRPKPYQRLLDAVQAPPERQAGSLRDFVTHWYAELDRPPKKGLSRQTAMQRAAVLVRTRQGRWRLLRLLVHRGRRGEGIRPGRQPVRWVAPPRQINNLPALHTTKPGPCALELSKSGLSPAGPRIA